MVIRRFWKGLYSSWFCRGLGVGVLFLLVYFNFEGLTCFFWWGVLENIVLGKGLVVGFFRFSCLGYFMVFLF